MSCACCSINEQIDQIHEQTIRSITLDVERLAELGYFSTFQICQEVYEEYGGSECPLDSELLFEAAEEANSVYIAPSGPAEEVHRIYKTIELLVKQYKNSKKRVQQEIPELQASALSLLPELAPPLHQSVSEILESLEREVVKEVGGAQINNL